jgi:hypothetical protein
MRFDVDSIFFGVSVQFGDRGYKTYIHSSDKVKVWFEDGFFFIDEGGQDVICVVAPNVRQFTKKRVDESTGSKDSTKIRAARMDK